MNSEPSKDVMLAWVRGVADAVPAIRPILMENLADFDGDLHGHLLLGEITPWAEAQFREDPQSPALRTLLDALEMGLGLNDEYLDNAISVSFIENLGWDSPMFALFGPRMLETAKKMFPARFEE